MCQTPNSENIQDVQDFMVYREKILQNDPATLRVRRHELNHLLNWANNHPFSEASKIDPPFPIYLLSARNDGKELPLSPKSLNKICQTVRMFFTWSKREYPERYQNIHENWIQSIRPRRASGLQTQIKKRDFWPLDDVLKIARLSLDRLADQRDQAAICFLYLSGMRITAFATLPISCVDIQARRIEQLPQKGVRTKNHKAAVTTLLPIPELLDVVQKWDQIARAELPPASPWYSLISEAKTPMGIDRELVPNWGMALGRRDAVIEGIKRLCRMANLPFRSPHKLRHGHAIYGMKHARNIEQLKAISQNLMHGSLAVTDGIYGNLAEDDVRSAIASLGPLVNDQKDISIVFQVLKILSENPALLKSIVESLNHGMDSNRYPSL